MFPRLLYVALILGCFFQTITVAQNYSLSAEPVGFVVVGGAPIGGGNATPQIVKTYKELSEAVKGDDPRVIIVSGYIKTTDGGGYGMPVGSNKTILGINKEATIYGGIAVNNVSNVIVRNLNFQGIYPNSGPDDAIQVQNSHHIWFDHLNIWDAGDGNLDITKESNYCTVSWCKFYYTNSKNGHRLCALIGSGGGDHPEDWGKLKVTYHHNWFDKLVDSRMPRVVYGEGHVYNNYYTSEGNEYCVGVGSYGSVLVEKNYFKKVNNPHQFMYEVYCYMIARDNVYDGCKGGDVNKKSGSRHSGWKMPNGELHPKYEVQPLNALPYAYTMDDARDIPELVSTYAGPQDDITSILSSPLPFASHDEKHVLSFNPVNRALSLQFPASEILDITISALNGKEVLSGKIIPKAGNRKTEMSLNSLANGVYLIGIEYKGTFVNGLVSVR